ncbi:helix-turn-helix domain-containing protein [Alteribacillus bidgolensis]|uniref:Transcriptional regulator, AraC family n=1 Tax=Alteribacillus bidgolensis TaxID=930129 RepID=A0A1G8RHH8_9BACI|nr:helix-turn-helix domain-containing protein [Alteribacillus bidgolensis]SDJ15955.1 transcriptional regulator, AraC family [Alteribacillus bidgolensis]
MTTLTFFPSQPEVQYKMDNYIEQKPLKLPIRKHIALFYQFETQKNSVNSFSLIPDGCFDMLFCCSSTKPSGFLWTSPLQRREQLNFEVGCKYFGVRFTPEQGIINLKYSMRELLGEKIPLDDVMVIDPFFVEQIVSRQSFSERVHLFEKFIESLFSDSIYQNIVEYSINQIYESKGNININQLSMDTGYSDRYIRKKFEESIGFSPKQFSEIVRFQNSLAMLFTDNNKQKLSDVVYENGYHDQAHFVKGFKKFVDLTPTQFIQNLS